MSRSVTLDPPKEDRVSTQKPLVKDAVPVRHYGQWATAAVILVLAASLVTSLVQNENIDYPTVFEYLTYDAVLQGLLVTFQLSVIGMVGGTVLGVIIALARMSENRVVKFSAQAYIWLFRGTPLLVQMLIWGNFALLFPILGIGVPFTDIMFVEVPTNAVITTFVAACLGLALHEAAYMAEVVRGGIMSVSFGQREAATALGMTSMMAMTRVVLPQTFRVIIPPTGNQFIALLKASSLVSVIAGGELLTAVQNIAAGNYRTIEMLLVACFWYLAIVSVFTIGQHYLERRASKGYSR